MSSGIYEALAAIIAEMAAIGKEKKCVQGGFLYRGIDDVYNVLNPLLGKHGVFILPEAMERTSENRVSKSGSHMEIVVLRMKYTFCATDGSTVSCVTIGEAMDSGDKATNKAMSIAHKYAILQTFCIPTEDIDDPDSQKEPLPAPPKRMTSDQAKALMEYLRRRHGDDKDAYLQELTAFLGWEVKSSSDLSYNDVAWFLEDRKKRGW